MQERLERVRHATELPAADVDLLLMLLLLPPVVEIPEAVANSTRRFVAFVSVGCMRVCVWAVVFRVLYDDDDDDNNNNDDHEHVDNASHAAVVT